MTSRLLRLLPKRASVMFLVGMGIIVWFAIDRREVGTEWLFIIGVLLGLPMLGSDHDWGKKISEAKDALTSEEKRDE